MYQEFESILISDTESLLFSMLKSFKGFIASISAVSGLCLIAVFSPSTLQARDLGDNLRGNEGRGCKVYRQASLDSSSPLKMQVKNASNNSVRLTWIDFNGGQKEYAVVEPSKSYIQDTYESHLWVIEGVKNGSCKAVVKLGESDTSVIIGPDELWTDWR